MMSLAPVTLEGGGIRLEPLTPQHHDDLVRAASDGTLWDLWYTRIPDPSSASDYIKEALDGQKGGHMLPWAVRDLADDRVIGTTRFHDINPVVDRVEIGYTFYAQSRQRTNVNRTCKLLLLTHAFETVKARVVGFRADNFNFRSQAAILGLGARFDGSVRRFQPRRDGTPRDTMFYSILVEEWPDVKRHIELKLTRRASASTSSTVL
jgi:RimJ/RimL family protein N-acetyltransferase